VAVVRDTNVMVAALVTNGLCHEVLHRAVRLRGSRRAGGCPQPVQQVGDTQCPCLSREIVAIEAVPADLGDGQHVPPLAIRHLVAHTEPA